MPSPSIDGQNRGYVIPIGGAEEKIIAEILEKFVLIWLAAGREFCYSYRIASGNTGDRYISLFKDLGAGDATSLPMAERSVQDDLTLMISIMQLLSLSPVAISASVHLGEHR